MFTMNECTFVLLTCAVHNQSLTVTEWKDAIDDYFLHLVDKTNRSENVLISEKG